jgi:hypothetical protein
MAAGHVIVVVFLALLGGGILNAQALTDAAARQPFGWKRTIAVVAATPFRGISGVLGLDRPYRVLASAASGATGGPQSVATDPPVASGGPATQPDESGSAEQPSEGTGEGRATEAPPTEPAQRTATRRDPLQVWIGGDSLTSEFGPALADRLAPTRKADADVEYRFSTGLARPDYFNWPARLKQIRDKDDPDVFVVMFGANDGQNMEVQGNVLPFGSPEWETEYTGRVDAVMNLLARDGRTLYWVGQPIARSPDFDAKMQQLNTIYAEQARGRADVSYVDSHDLFTGPDGGYSAYLGDVNGQPVLMRQQDGVHLTRAGGERLATVVFDALDERWSLVRSAPAG